MSVPAKAQNLALPVDGPLPRGRGALPPAVVEASQRRRLLESMTTMAAAKGIAAVTVADVTAEAGVSRKAFYALFSDKVDCYLAGFTANGRMLLAVVRHAIESADDPTTGILDGFLAYLRTLAANPTPARAYLLEGMRSGPEVVAQRERAYRELVELNLRALKRAGRATGVRRENAVVALVGGINELVCRELDRRGGRPDLMALEPDVIDLVVSVLRLEGARP